MSAKILDCQGLPCPQPVLKCKKHIDHESPASLQITVDNEAAKENVIRYLGTRGYASKADQQGTSWIISANSEGMVEGKPEKCSPPSNLNPNVPKKIAVFITSDKIGRGDDDLGGKLMGNFLSTLPELGNEIWRIILVNSAVKMAVSGSDKLAAIQQMEESGVSVLVCGTCLDHFGLMKGKKVGETTNMLDVVTSLQLATKIIQV